MTARFMKCCINSVGHYSGQFHQLDPIPPMRNVFAALECISERKLFKQSHSIYGIAK